MSIPVQMMLHSIFMILGFVLLLFAVRISSKKKNNLWLKKHRVTAIFGVLSVITGLLIMVVFKESQGYPHLKSPHSIGGLVTVIAVLTTPILGYLITRGKQNDKKIHKLSGKITLILVGITIISGFVRVWQIVNK